MYFINSVPTKIYDVPEVGKSSTLVKVIPVVCPVLVIAALRVVVLAVIGVPPKVEIP